MSDEIRFDVKDGPFETLIEYVPRHQHEECLAQCNQLRADLAQRERELDEERRAHQRVASILAEVGDPDGTTVGIAHSAMSLIRGQRALLAQRDEQDAMLREHNDTAPHAGCKCDRCQCYVLHGKLAEAERRIAAAMEIPAGAVGQTYGFVCGANWMRNKFRKALTQVTPAAPEGEQG